MSMTYWVNIMSLARSVLP